MGLALPSPSGDPQAWVNQDGREAGREADALPQHLISGPRSRSSRASAGHWGGPRTDSRWERERTERQEILGGYPLHLHPAL